MYYLPAKVPSYRCGRVVCQGAFNPVEFDKQKGNKATGDTALREGVRQKAQEERGGDEEEGLESLEIILSPHLRGWTSSSRRV